MSETLYMRISTERDRGGWGGGGRERQTERDREREREMAKEFRGGPFIRKCHVVLISVSSR